MFHLLFFFGMDCIGLHYYYSTTIANYLWSSLFWVLYSSLLSMLFLCITSSVLIIHPCHIYIPVFYICLLILLIPTYPWKLICILPGIYVDIIHSMTCFYVVTFNLPSSFISLTWHLFYIISIICFALSKTICC